jgi:hypothetical protein
MKQPEFRIAQSYTRRRASADFRVEMIHPLGRGIVIDFPERSNHAVRTGAQEAHESPSKPSPE